eukprot:TRINITY_DN40045_c0_g1_i1.p1 TRINITY_DN40045_c0_g1~~TRINITY_DN40045_c0_g1_i1.p1  ORF type:complete len:176 (-),score=34.29 TRINITY_DN40045_c0_g1_i1:162-689(-)
MAELEEPCENSDFECGFGVENCRIIHNKVIVEAKYRGDFVPWDKPLVPFKTTRCNYMWNVPEGTIRGHHAHTKVYELCVCVQGSMTVSVEDASGTKEMHISKPTEGALICPNTWIVLKDFAPGTILLILCSGEFDPKECIRSREVFEERFLRKAAPGSNGAETELPAAKKLRPSN